MTEQSITFVVKKYLIIIIITSLYLLKHTSLPTPTLKLQLFTLRRDQSENQRKTQNSTEAD